MAVTGQCECGAVRFEADEVRESVTYCHCSQCRRTSGHQWAATRADLNKFRLSGEEALTWYASSDKAKRGFCSVCGSSLFYQWNGASFIGIAAGCVEEPTGLIGGRHIFTDSKGDYYEITDDLPQVRD